MSIPAKPVAIERFMHDDLLRLVDVQDRHAVDRAAGIVARGRIDDVVRADHEHDVRLRELRLTSSISLSAVYGTFASASSTFMCPGMRPATGWIA